jgi:hypothetical protein
MRYLLLSLLGATVFLFARLSDLSELGLLSKGIPVIALLLWPPGVRLVVASADLSKR